MEDLDALLADLQSTTSHINANQAGLANNSRNSFQSDKDSGSSTPPPLPPPPPQEVLDKLPASPSSDCYHQVDGPLYEPQQLRAEIRVRERTPTSDTSSRNSDNIPPDKPPPPKPRMTQLSNNLSELDQLLQDLDSAQFMQEVDRKSSGITHATSNGMPKQPPPPVAPKPGQPQRNSVDNLLDNLERSVPSPGYQSGMEQQGVYEGMSPVPRPSYQHQPPKSSGEKSASSATRELENLMGSLSEFQVSSQKGTLVTTGTADNQAGDPAYAKPKKGRGTELSPTQSVEQSTHGSQLDTMLGDLQSDMNRQGVSTKTKGVCAACNKPVVGQIITALGKIWHLEHFVCDKCGDPLGTKNFYERDGLAYCETDYHNLFAPRCAYCNGPIIDKCITALNNTWHPDHFFCAMCGKNFGEEGFHEKDGQAYCRDDYFNLFAPKCGGCGRPIIDNYISALNRQWHPECFVCWDCRTPFGSGSFFDHEGLPYCETHYHEKRGSLCAGCQKPITGRCITAMYRKFHPEHFVCAFCLKQLNKGTFKEQNDKPYCHPCFVKLFS